MYIRDQINYLLLLLWLLKYFNQTHFYASIFMKINWFWNGRTYVNKMKCENYKPKTLKWWIKECLNSNLKICKNAKNLIIFVLPWHSEFKIDSFVNRQDFKSGQILLVILFSWFSFSLVLLFDHLQVFSRRHELGQLDVEVLDDESFEILMGPDEMSQPDLMLFEGLGAT